MYAKLGLLCVDKETTKTAIVARQKNITNYGLQLLINTYNTYYSIFKS